MASVESAVPDAVDPRYAEELRRLHDPFFMEPVPIGIALKLFGSGEHPEPLSADEQAHYEYIRKRREEAEERRDLLGIVDLADVMEEGGTDPEMLVENLLLKAAHTLIFGPKEQGKTWCALCAAAEVMARGGTVVWVDKEMGRSLLADRLVSLGLPAQLVRERLVYMEYPTMDGSKESRALWKMMLEYRQPELIVVDAQTEVLADASLNENLGTDIDKWMGWYLTPARRLGITTAILDHTGHDEASRSRGSGHKGNAAKVELAVTCVEPFGRETVGVLKIERKKNTADAPLPEVQWYRIGGSAEGFVWERCVVPPDASATGATKKEKAYAQVRLDAERLLRERAGTRLTWTQIRGMLKGSDAVKREALASLHTDPASPVQCVPEGSSLLYTYAPDGGDTGGDRGDTVSRGDTGAERPEQNVTPDNRSAQSGTVEPLSPLPERAERAERVGVTEPSVQRGGLRSNPARSASESVSPLSTLEAEHPDWKNEQLADALVVSVRTVQRRRKDGA